MTYTISLWAKFKLKRAKLRIAEKRGIQFHLVEQPKIMHYRDNDRDPREKAFVK